MKTIDLRKLPSVAVEELKHERNNNTRRFIYERQGRNLLWAVPLQIVNGRSPVQIMEENGFHPAGYGMPWDIKVELGHLCFKCSASSD